MGVLPRTTGRLIALGAAVGVMAMTGCSMTRPVELWTDDALRVRQLEDTGDYDAADREYRALQQAPPEGADTRWIAFRRAEILRKKGERNAALEAYQIIWSADRVDTWGARASLNHARLMLEGSREQGIEGLTRTILGYPNEAGADDALADLVRLHEGDPTALDALLAELTPKLDGTYLAGNVRFARAQNLDQGLQDIDAAALLYREIWVDHREDAISDDALWEMTQLFRRVQAWPQAVINLRVFADNTESSWFVGSYDSQWVNDAVFDLGWIHLVYLDDYDAALTWFDRFAADYEDSLRTPEALFWASEALRLKGDSAGRVEYLRRVQDDYPDSKWSRRARAVLEGVRP